MDPVIQSMVAAAAGTGAPTNPNSRYYGAGVEFFTMANGTQVAYLSRRIIPQGTSTRRPQLFRRRGDRLDNLAYKYLGDPILFWMICRREHAAGSES